MGVASMSYQSGDGAAAGTYHQSRQRAKEGRNTSSQGRDVRYPPKINFS